MTRGFDRRLRPGKIGAMEDLPASRRCMCAWGLAPLLLGGAFFVDAAVASWARESGCAAWMKRAWIADVIKAPGTYYFTLALSIILYFAHRRRLWAAALVALAGALTGINPVLKWMAGRRRPFKFPDRMGELLPFQFEPFAGGVTGLWRVPNLAFPSGHTILAFATAAALARELPRWRWAFYLGAAMVGAERILETAHWTSDAVAAAILGVLCERIANWVIGRTARLQKDSAAG